MNNTLDEMIAVIQAHKDGKKIQFTSPTELSDGWPRENAWLDIDDPTFRFHDTVYRIKPEPPKPREWWMRTHYTDGMPCSSCGMFSSKADAGCMPSDDQPLDGIIHVREVLPE